MKDKKNNKDGLFVLILLLIVVVAVLFFPKINSLIEKAKLPKIQDIKEEKPEEKKEVEDEVLNELHYPLMRSSAYNINTYYSLDKFSISNMSNQDILNNAFLDVYEGNMTPNNYYGCTNDSKKLDAKYIKLRIKNILGNDVKYNLENFYVPEDANSNFVGNWVYDSTTDSFIYSGLCESTNANIKYYDLTQFIKAEYNNSDVIVYKYVSFAKIENNNFTIYSDSDLKDKITSGTFTTLEDLQTIFEGINNNSKKIYKYIFKDTLCSYNEYCLYEGVWVNEL